MLYHGDKDNLFLLKNAELSYKYLFDTHGRNLIWKIEPDLHNNISKTGMKTLEEFLHIHMLKRNMNSKMSHSYGY